MCALVLIVVGGGGGGGSFDGRCNDCGLWAMTTGGGWCI
jgi:hypothetical protein